MTESRLPPVPATPRGLIAQLDPRTRVIAAVLFALAAVAARGLAAELAALGVAAVLAALGRVPSRRLLRLLLTLEGFMLVTVATLPFSLPGQPVFSLWGWPASAEGLARAASVVLKANAVVLAVQALLGSLDPVALGHALARLGVPERLAALLMFTIRYIEVLRQEYARLRLAMRARAFRPRSNWHTWRTMGWLVGMLLVMSLERSTRIHAAMRLRGFSGRFHLLDDCRAGALDWGFGAAHLASMAAIATVGSW